jgi:heparinase II/III-like protein
MTLVSNARRLVRMDAGEFRFRAECHARRAIDRTRHALAPPKWNQTKIARILDPGVSAAVARACNAVRGGEFLTAHRALSSHFITRASVWPFRADAARDVAVTITDRFPGAKNAAIARADRIARGCFDLLGYHDLDYGSPPDWHLDAVHGRHPPRVFWASVPYLDPASGDHKVVWELNRHQHWIALGRAFALSGDDRYRDVFVRELQSWIAENPPLAGANWASMLELALRAISWMWAIEFFSRGADQDRTPWLIDLLVALDRQLDHVAHNLSRYFSPNTHLSGEALALYAVSQALPELRGSERRAAIGRALLIAEASKQILADGGHIEQSSHYHRYSTDFYLLALLVARRSNDPAAAVFERAARAQAEYLRRISDDHGQLPLIGDDDGGQLTGWCGTRPSDASVTLGIAAAALEDPSLAVRSPSEEVYWWLGAAVPVEQVGARTTWPSKLLAASGYFVSRNRDGDHLIFDAGKHGFLNGGHAHSDALSVVLSVRGQPLLVDPGTATYTMDPALRDRFRSTRMHNTVVLDRRDHAKPQGPFHWQTNADARVLFARTADGFDFVEGTHDAYEHASHVRSVLSLHGIGWIIVDHVLGDREVEAEAWWHIHPSWSLSLDRALASSEPVRRTDVGEYSLYAPEYGRIDHAPAICVMQRGRPPISFATFIPARAPATAPIAVRRVAIELAVPQDWVGSAFHITTMADLTVLVATRLSRDGAAGGPPGVWGTADIRTDARVCVVSRESVIALIDGHTVEVRQPMASAVQESQVPSST